MTALALAACSPASVAPLPVGVADYQLGQAYPPAQDVTVVVRDSTATPAPGVYSVCYVNAFQTQPDEAVDPDLLLEPDPAWPDEFLLDTAQRDALTGRVAAVLGRCDEAGFDAVELDNLDSWTRSDGRLDRADTLAIAAEVTDAAHGLGLAVGQKNTPELTADEVAAIGFDFAVAEECHEFDECAAYTALYGDQVLDVEYTGTLADICADPDRLVMTVLRDRELTAPGSPEHVREHC
ncbi:endo alpha-1,4 polygalactosaminidase [Cellulomonas humilata]|uniref:Endo alpha-1,4 polygalactosaminidase n=2 Tax=Cellulomonas humilata TaxID=144055 RepID=A0A7Y5ZYW6_9CELL|nr:endo alpha-1,4 polygalactosaminidase [Cellulomonas humilata]NUU16691.1 endo alpha-1,4 polygalactosaminidase [Cellulomonas humilata]